MGVVDENFVGAGKNTGLEIWRIKNFKVLPLDKSEYGTFYSGDSYVVLSTTGTPNGRLSHNVHFWIGSDTSKDEMGTSAIKTVELDEALGGGPVQYREVQDHESSTFLSYFRNGVKYLKGGYESGFRRVGDEKFEPRLFQCKGKRNVRVRQVDLSRDSLNLGDVFILDSEDDILVWCPPESGRLERIKGIQQATNIRDQERAGRGTIEVLDTDWDKHPVFWEKIGGSAEHVKKAEAGGCDETYFRNERPEICLWRVSDATGRMVIQSVGKGDLSAEALDSKDAFILDASSGGLYVWVGKGCTMDERKKAMVYAGKYLEERNRPKYTQVLRVLEGAEPALFTQWFATKPSNRPAFQPHLFQCSNESGKLVIEEISNFSQQDLDGDDVMILDGCETVYVWIGNGANEQEKASAVGIAKKYLDTDAIPRPQGAKSVNLNQGEETDEFKKFFKSWDDNMFKEERSVDAVKKQLHLAKV